MRSNFALALKGAAMGIAEVIPGVSGGTIAFITGIYEQLIDSIKNLDAKLVGFLASLQLIKAFNYLNGPFLAVLVIGMVGGIVIGIFGVSALMVQYPEELWGFFFGLILASAWYVGKRVDKWDARTAILMIAGIAAAWFITRLAPASGSENLGYVFLCGVIAISALILPGVSGSFMLLLMGMYTVIIPTLKSLLVDFECANFFIIAVFAAGCLTGLITTARALSWLFHNRRSMTLSFLTGIMLGSLNKIWPWRNPLSWLNEKGEVVSANPYHPDAKVLLERNVLPADYIVAEPNTWVVIACMIVGIGTVLILERFSIDDTENS